tara:strand:+ start:7328 stop:8680 length:1353 start_codon:yes stop_codon:yes gene_type:complete
MIKKAIRAWSKGSRVERLPDVIFHIGAPKAGSSAIQRFCQTHPEILAKLGYFYPEHTLDVNGVSGGHTQLAGALLNGKLEQAKVRLEDWLEEARKRKLCLLVSGEALYGQAEQMRQLTNTLDVRVVGFLRHPVDYLLGNHNQGIKRHMQTRRLGQLLMEQAGRPAPHLVGLPLLKWADAYGDAQCHFLPYRSPGQGGAPIERRFLEVLGMPEKEAKALVGNVAITNRSYVTSALELKRLLNTVLPELPDGLAHRVDWGLQGYSDKAQDEQGLSQTDIAANIRQQLLDELMPQMAPVVTRFPALAEVAEIPVSTQKAPRQSWLNLSAPLEALEQGEPELMTQVRQAARSLRDNGRCDYTFFKLLDVLGIEFEEPSALQNPLSPAARRVLTSEKSRDADVLREMAVMLERLGYLDDAMLAIEQALVRRPKGTGIQKIHQRVAEKIKVRKEMA